MPPRVKLTTLLAVIASVFLFITLASCHPIGEQNGDACRAGNASVPAEDGGPPRPAASIASDMEGLKHALGFNSTSNDTNMFARDVESAESDLSTSIFRPELTGDRVCAHYPMVVFEVWIVQVPPRWWLYK